MNLDDLLKMSNRYGADEEYVLAGGGNTSYKENGVMYVKGSGTSLSTITADQFVAMDLQLLHDMIGREYPVGLSDADREALTLSDMMAAKLPGEEAKRPSVEAILHAIFPYKFVLHVHPALVNGLTCGAGGDVACPDLLGEKVVWVGLSQPGLGLARECSGIFSGYKTRFGCSPQIVVLKNHGIFIAADSVPEIDEKMGYVMDKLRGRVTEFPDFSALEYDADLACVIAPALRMLYSGGSAEGGKGADAGAGRLPSSPTKAGEGSGADTGTGASVGAIRLPSSPTMAGEGSGADTGAGASVGAGRLPSSPTMAGASAGPEAGAEAEAGADPEADANSCDNLSVAIFCTNKTVASFVSSAETFKPLVRPFTPDHIVYCMDEPLFIEPDADLTAAFSAFVERKGFRPKIAAVRGLGFFALGGDAKEAERARLLFLDAVKVATYAGSFGGANPLPEEFVDFITGWEVEKYRSRAISTGVTTGRLTGRIAIVTGGAQGFGKGIAEEVAAQGAYITVADLNPDGAKACAAELNERFGAHTAIAVQADVSDEASVGRMVQETVLAFGGLDILVSNAGVLIAGGLGELSKDHFDLVTKVNYTGYFLCAKYAAKPMKIQREFAPGHTMDIIEINSKSGLEGSNKNFAYAGSKFGGIGLTQSFAMELVEHGIKVNAICPGNLLDGPLWSDPEHGLFKQYLDSGKVAGAKTIDDVRRFYEAKVPMGRGCRIKDVARAIFYVVEQKYETGQALPVTGGQIMLR